MVLDQPVNKQFDPKSVVLAYRKGFARRTLNNFQIVFVELLDRDRMIRQKY